MTRAKSAPREHFSLKMRDAEIVIVNGDEYACALRYAPGETPVVLLKGRKAAAKDIIWSAQELEVPIVEMTSFDEEYYSGLTPDEVIPESLFKPVSQAMAFLYRTKASPHLLRFVKTLRKRPGILTTSTEELVERYSSFLEVSLVSLELGKGLYGEVEILREPLDTFRQRIALEIGLVIPEIRAHYNSKLGALHYSLRLRDVPVYEGNVEGTLEPNEYVHQIINRLRTLIVRQSWQLLGYIEVNALLERMKKYNPLLFRDLFPEYFSVPSLRFVLRNLLKEGISIRDLSKICEVIKENLHITRDPDVITEFVRAAFAPYLCHKYKNSEGGLEVLLLSPEMEKMIGGSVKEASHVRWLDLEPENGYRLLTSLGDELKKAQSIGLDPVLLVTPGLRRFIKRLLENSFPDLPVISYNEIVPFADVRSVGVVG
ncbi:MAG: FHIPEP family type III secretion protein [Candidatus Eremiobacteraeota bacterium]|nr:FHIPEP family type III secretion protein [Candidatus Eremiobacteraeota bacterium]